MDRAVGREPELRGGFIHPFFFVFVFIYCLLLINRIYCVFEDLLSLIAPSTKNDQLNLQHQVVCSGALLDRGSSHFDSTLPAYRQRY